MRDEFYRIQTDLLTETCQPKSYLPENMFLASGLKLYYNPTQNEWYKRPDWYMVLGRKRVTQQENLRHYYVKWEENVSPFLVIELLSPDTASEDLAKNLRGLRLRGIIQQPTKWDVYENILRIPFYITYDRYIQDLQVFTMCGGTYYPTEIPENRFWLEKLGLGLGLWQGIYQGISGLWLRWYDESGWIPTLAEKADAESQRADKLAAYLRSQGLDPDNIPV